MPSGPSHRDDHTFDAIVVGTGISGGWAAKELCERGLRTLVLERGRNVEHVTDYPTMDHAPWELKYGDQLTHEDLRRYHVQSRDNHVRQSTKHWFVDDEEHPYIEKKRFDWIRGYHVGGRSLMWSRQTYRLSDLDFEANAREGIATDWPLRYRDIAPWYDHVESFVGINGNFDGLPHLPDGKFLPPMEMNCVERHTRDKIAEHFDDRVMIIGRSANLTRPHNDRGQCMYRNLCIRGCPFGGYFSSPSSTLPAAARTGRMLLRPHSIVSSVVYDGKRGRATGVRVIDANTGQHLEFSARIIFLNASTLGSTFILLNSKSPRFPTGMGNDSDQLGRNLMDHHFRAGASGDFDGMADRYYLGRRPNGIYVPRFRNLGKPRQDFVRGYGFQGRASREDWTRTIGEMSFGAGFKETLRQPGKWRMGLGGFGECLPYADNRVTLDPDARDRWGLPLLSIDCEFRDNELAMRKDMTTSAAEILEAAGFSNVTPFDDIGGPGLGIHEMGTARMGRDPKTSVLGAHNQIHAVPNVFVTDGACMTSSSCQNPSLTYMALTARAAAHAVEQLRAGKL